ncbi:DUF5666 domain-containing protein [Meiothermus rufus]|uniref:DUF5666 domain-containing protein n=1 Tax=Meiothermus rufus TaxID=604332 RepID=UPI000415A333|nr:DUF5666 domain-containing protein [Meiothermus rufus]
MLRVLAFLLLALLPALASPYEYEYLGGYPRLEIKGQVEAFDRQQGYIIVNGQRFWLDANVYYKYGLPQVGSWVEVKAYRTNRGTWVVYKVERKRGW